MAKITFRCPKAIGAYDWLVTPFSLKNARPTYQRAMNKIFYDLIGKFMKLYISDIVVKSSDTEGHLTDLC